MDGERKEAGNMKRKDKQSGPEKYRKGGRYEEREDNDKGFQHSSSMRERERERLGEVRRSGCETAEGGGGE